MRHIGFFLAAAMAMTGSVPACPAADPKTPQFERGVPRGRSTRGGGHWHCHFYSTSYYRPKGKPRTDAERERLAKADAKRVRKATKRLQEKA